MSVLLDSEFFVYFGPDVPSYAKMKIRKSILQIRGPEDKRMYET
jgi:hypothetical protein